MDIRAKDLAKRALTSLASITGVRLWSDKDGEDDALGVELSEFVNSDPVAEGSDIDYQALTPKGFAASTANYDRKGIVEQANSTEMANGETNKYPDCAIVKGAIDAKSASTELTPDYSGSDADFSSENVKIAKVGNIYMVTGTFVSAETKSTPALLCTIPGYSNADTVEFVAQQAETSNLEGGYGYIGTDGKVYVKPGKGNSQTWYFNCPAITFTRA